MIIILYNLLYLHTQLNDKDMKTLTLILTAYSEGKITLNDMSSYVNEFGTFLGFSRQNGKRILKARINGEIVIASVSI